MALILLRLFSNDVELLTLLHEAPVERLNRPNIMGIEPAKDVDLLWRDLHWSLQHKPGHVFCARRRRQRSHIHEVSPVRGQQVGRVDLDSGNVLFFADGPRRMLPDLLDGGARASGRQKNCDSDNLAIVDFCIRRSTIS
jgi:hypothetical protein